jgi:hypothetical protein
MTTVVSIGVLVDLDIKPAVSVLLPFASRPDCRQNQTALPDKLRLLSDRRIVRQK